jgi:hypothetical protein
MALDSRSDVIQSFRDRIQHGDHTRLSQNNLEVMIDGFVEELRGIRAKTKIRALCEAEIKLLEEGYPQASVAKYLSRYRKAIKAAVDDGSLPMTRYTSHRYIHQQRVTGIREERHEHWALTYLKYSNEVYEMLDQRQQVVQMDETATADTHEVDAEEVKEPIPVVLELPLEVVVAVSESKAIESENSRDGDDMAITDDWRMELNRQVQQIRAEFTEQFHAAKQGHSVGWFMRRIETLEEDNLKLRLEQDRAITSGGTLGQDDAEEMGRLKAENMAIAAELKAVQQKLDAFRQLLDGDAAGIVEGKAEDGVIALHPQVKQGSTQSPQPQDEGDNPRPKGTTRGTAEGVARGPKAGKAFQRAEAIFSAIKDWNRLNPTESFAINPGVLETIFRVHRQAVKQFFEAYQNELWDYHQELGVESPKWHNRGKDTGKLKAFVQDRVKEGAIA